MFSRHHDHYNHMLQLLSEPEVMTVLGCKAAKHGLRVPVLKFRSVAAEHEHERAR